MDRPTDAQIDQANRVLLWLADSTTNEYDRKALANVRWRLHHESHPEVAAAEGRQKRAPRQPA
jgi:hypothetical protein